MKKIFTNVLSLFLVVLLIAGAFPSLTTAQTIDPETHIHTEACYAETGELVCGYPESTAVSIEESGEVLPEEEAPMQETQTPDPEIPIEYPTETQSENITPLPTDPVETPTDMPTPIVSILETPSPEGTIEITSVPTNDQRNMAPMMAELLAVPNPDADLKALIENADSGSVITLTENVNYDQSSLGSILVSKEITLDFNGYRVTTNGEFLSVTETGKLTLVNTQITSTGNLVMGVNEGVLVFQSTAGNGIVGYSFMPENLGELTVCAGTFILSGDFFVEYNRGNLNVVSGSFTLSRGDYIYENYGNVTITEGNFVISDNEFIEYNYGGDIVLQNGSFVIYGDFVYENRSNEEGLFGEILVNYVNFQSFYNGFIDTNYGGNVTVNNGNFVTYDPFVDSSYGGNITIDNGNFSMESYGFDDLFDTTLIIKNADVRSIFYILRYDLFLVE